MADKSKIEWCDATWNPVTGCSPISAGCEHCYAARMVKRFPHLHSCASPDDRPAFNRIVNHIGRLDIPLHWKKPRKIFVCSMGDLFHKGSDLNWILAIYNIMRNCPQHIFMVLTKRPESAREFYFWNGKDDTFNLSLPNLWLGVTCENQEMADKRIPILLQIPAAKRFVSYEPGLGPIDISELIGYNVVHETKNERNVSLSVSAIGGIGDRQKRKCLANEGQAREPMERWDDNNSVQKTESRTRYGTVSTGSSNDELEKGGSVGSPIGLGSLQWSNTDRSNHQSQEREQEGQSAGEFRTGNLFRADTSFDKSIGTSQKEGSSGKISWVICGPETGPGARPMNLDWARSLRDQCVAARVPFFYKRGELDGKLWHQFPESA